MIVASIEAWLCGVDEVIAGAFAVEYRLAVRVGCANVLNDLFAATLGSCNLIHPLIIMLMIKLRYGVGVFLAS